MMGTATASGVDRARIAAEQAVASPLLDGIDLSGARGVLVNVTASRGLKGKEIKEVMAAVRAFAAAVQERVGAAHVLINNAGIGYLGKFLESDLDHWRRVMAINVMGVVHGCHAFMPQMLAHGRGGHIVSTASLAAEVVMPAHLAIYAASKAAVCHYCEAVKGELGEQGIGVSILLPGPIKSNIHQANQNRPEHLRGNSGFVESEQKLSERQIGDTWMEPEEVGEMVAKGILANSTYIVTHGIFKDFQRARAQAVLDATPDVENSAVRGL
jgi:short-subunit dehydrogenase